MYTSEGNHKTKHICTYEGPSEYSKHLLIDLKDINNNKLVKSLLGELKTDAFVSKCVCGFFFFVSVLCVVLGIEQSRM